MGLDVVELVIRTEETFAVELPNSECEQVRTVGDLYRLILKKLDLPYQSASSLEESLEPPYIGRDRSMMRFPALVQWNTADVWATLKGLICDQLQVTSEEVRESASFIDDLGAD